VAHPEINLQLADHRPDEEDLRPERQRDDHQRGKEPPVPGRVRRRGVPAAAAATAAAAAAAPLV
jgi:hypothetical protein